MLDVPKPDECPIQRYREISEQNSSITSKRTPKSMNMLEKKYSYSLGNSHIIKLHHTILLAKKSSHITKNRLCERVKRRCLIFPWSCPHSIIRAEELNFRVRDGNGCTLFAIVTSSPAHTGVSLDTVYTIMFRECCQYFLRGNPEIDKNS